MSGTEMEKFWDARAREDALFFIDTRRPFKSDEIESFWAGGVEDLQTMLVRLGAEVSSSDVALDIGCGVGRLTRALAQRAKLVYGIDVSGEMISRATTFNRDVPNVRWLQGDGVSLRPLEDGSVDAVISVVVFQHIPDPEVTYGYVREIGRVLRIGGWAAIHVSNDPALHRKASGPGLRQRLNELRGTRPRGRDHRAWLGSAVDMTALRTTAREVNLDFERVIGEGTQYCAILARRVDDTS
jgi:SAM-dependent methyltransferase